MQTLQRIKPNYSPVPPTFLFAAEGMSSISLNSSSPSPFSLCWYRQVSSSYSELPISLGFLNSAVRVTRCLIASRSKMPRTSHERGSVPQAVAWRMTGCVLSWGKIGEDIERLRMSFPLVLWENLPHRIQNLRFLSNYLATVYYM